MTISLPDAAQSSAPAAVDAYALLEASPTPTVLTGWDATVLYVNAAAEGVLRRPRADFLGRPAREAFAEERGTELGDTLGRALRERTAVMMQTYLPLAGRWMEVNAQPTADGLAVFLRDLTGAREVVAALHESREWASLVYEAASDAMFLVQREEDGGFRCRSVNASYLAATGLDAEQVVGHRVEAILRGPSLTQALAKNAEALESRRPVRHTEAIDLRGSLVYFETTLTPIHDARVNAFPMILGSSRDVTARVLAEQERARLAGQLLQAQKMEAMGRLAGGVAHDFNNLLTAIKCNCELLLDDASLGEEARVDVGEIGRTADRAAALTRQLLMFSRKQTLEPRVFDLNGVVAGVDRMLRRLIVDDVTLIARPSAESCLVLADAAQLEQVLVNLAVNARDAMPDGGAVTIETRHETLDAPRPYRHGIVSAGDWVVLAVTDSGTGMDDATLVHLFEPFFTTKPQGQGTGLGLSTVYGIVSQCGGHVLVRSGLEQGSTFEIYLPEAATER